MKHVKEWIKHLRDSIYARYERAELRDKNFILIANNCWGYTLYDSLGREYNTPFIGLFLYPECYLRLLENLDDYLESKLQFSNQSRYFAHQVHYPIGYLRDIEIHFLHYDSVEEAQAKWSRRLIRMQQARAKGASYCFKFCDRDGCTYEQLARFHALPYTVKLSLGAQPFPAQEHIHVPLLQEKNKKSIVDGATQFSRRYGYFDVTAWIKRGVLTRRLSARLLGLLA